MLAAAGRGGRINHHCLSFTFYCLLTAVLFPSRAVAPSSRRPLTALSFALGKVAAAGRIADQIEAGRQQPQQRPPAERLPQGRRPQPSPQYRPKYQQDHSRLAWEREEMQR